MIPVYKQCWVRETVMKTFTLRVRICTSHNIQYYSPVFCLEIRSESKLALSAKYVYTCKEYDSGFKLLSVHLHS